MKKLYFRDILLTYVDYLYIIQYVDNLYKGGYLWSWTKV